MKQPGMQKSLWEWLGPALFVLALAVIVGLLIYPMVEGVHMQFDNKLENITK